MTTMDWRFSRHLPWPGVRGQHLWKKLADGAARADHGGGAAAAAAAAATATATGTTTDTTKEQDMEAADTGESDEDELDDDYEVELCEPTAGHIALVLRRHDRVGAAASGPRVVYVVDAVPPQRKPRRATTNLQVPASAVPAWTMLTTRAHSFSGPTTSGSNSDGAASSPMATLRHQQQKTASKQHQQPYEVDEVELIADLFAAGSTGKDASLIARAPLLCARFDCRVVAVCFTRTNQNASSPSKAQTGSNSTSMSSLSAGDGRGGTAPLRCVVAREDGMCFIWEWGADLHHWSFLTRLCFLENASLQETMPVMRFTTVQSPWGNNDNHTISYATHGTSSTAGESRELIADTTELVWWSREDQQSPKLWVRKLQYGVDANTFRTAIRVGNAFQLPRVSVNAGQDKDAGGGDVCALLSSRLGLWIVSRSGGVHFRGATVLATLSRSWATLLPSNSPTNTSVVSVEPLACVQNVTGELVVLPYQPHARTTTLPLFVLAPHSSSSSSAYRLAVKTLTLTLTFESRRNSSGEALPRIVNIAAHRHILVAVIQCGPSESEKECCVFSLLTGHRLKQLALPHTSLASQEWIPWTITGRASSVGFWHARGGYCQLQTPPAHAMASQHDQAPSISNGSPSTDNTRSGHCADPAIASTRPYGTTLAFEATRLALDLLQDFQQQQEHQETVESSASHENGKIHTATAVATWARSTTVSNPALLLAAAPSLLDDALLDELARVVGSLYRVTHGLLVTGRLSAALDQRDPAAQRGVAQLTAANVEALHHLANWVLLAKRKLKLTKSATMPATEVTPTYVPTIPDSAVSRHGSRPQATSPLTTLTSADSMPVSFSAMIAALAPLDPKTKTLPDSPRVMEVDPDDSSSQLSRKLRPMSSLQFAAGTCALHGSGGVEWLKQLEFLLLHGRPPTIDTSTAPDEFADENWQWTVTPNHLLFHAERTLADFQRALSSFAKHMYFESMSRLYVLHRPKALHGFVHGIALCSPRLFSLSGWTAARRSHAERALTLLPPTDFFVARVLGTAKRNGKRKESPTSKSRHRASLLAYVDLLCLAGFYLDACRALLAADMYEDCIRKLLTSPLPRRLSSSSLSSPSPPTSTTTGGADSPDSHARVVSAIYFTVLEYCVGHRDATALTRLLQLRPPHVSVLLVFKVLKQLLPLRVSSTGTTGDSGCMTVGALRGVLVTMLSEHRTRSTT